MASFVLATGREGVCTCLTVGFVRQKPDFKRQRSARSSLQSDDNEWIAVKLRDCDWLRRRHVTVIIWQTSATATAFSLAYVRRTVLWNSLFVLCKRLLLTVSRSQYHCNIDTSDLNTTTTTTSLTALCPGRHESATFSSGWLQTLISNSYA